MGFSGLQMDLRGLDLSPLRFEILLALRTFTTGSWDSHPQSLESALICMY